MRLNTVGNSQFKSLFVALILLCAGTVWAEVEPSTVALPNGKNGIGPEYGKKDVQFTAKLGLHLGHFQADSDALSPSGLVGTFSVMQPLRRHEAKVEFGFVQYGLTVPGDVDSGQATAVDQSTFRVANAGFTYYFPWRSLRRQIRLGLGFTAPLAHLRSERVERTRADAFAYEGASAMGGHRNLWLWMPRTFSAIGHFDYYHRSKSGWIFGLQLDAAGAMRVSEEEAHNVAGLTTTPESVDVLAQSILEVAYDGESVKAGLSGSYVTAPLKDLPNGQGDQIATSLDLRFRLGKADFLTSILLPIDEPGGFAFDSDRHWALTFGFSTGTEQMLPR